jgi:hypothetical protein
VPNAPAAAVPTAMAGLAIFTHKSTGALAQRGLLDFLPSFGGAFYTKSARRPRQVPGQFPNRLEVIHKNVSDWF